MQIRWYHALTGEYLGEDDFEAEAEELAKRIAQTGEYDPDEPDDDDPDDDDPDDRS
jgi:hypothetical protein